MNLTDTERKQIITLLKVVAIAQALCTGLLIHIALSI